jgi:hypothetical protein
LLNLPRFDASMGASDIIVDFLRAQSAVRGG